MHPAGPIRPTPSAEVALLHQTGMPLAKLCLGVPGIVLPQHNVPAAS